MRKKHIENYNNNDKVVLIKNPNILSRNISGETIIFNPDLYRMPNTESLFLLSDPVSIIIWESIDGRKSIEKIKEKILEDFEVSKKQLDNDMDNLIKDFLEIEAIYYK